MASTGKQPLLKTKQAAALVNDVHTEIICTDFNDKLFVIVTQFKKIGTLIQVTRDVALEDMSTNQTYTTQVLMGKEDETIHVLARSLGAKIPVTKPILFSFALKDFSKSSMKAIEKIVLDNPVW